MNGYIEERNDGGGRQRISSETRRIVAGAITLACALGAWIVGWFGITSAWADDVPSEVPTYVSGSCYIGDTWMIGSQSFFAIPSFSGTLNGCVPCTAFECLNPTAAAPEYVDATYEARYVECNMEKGWVKYYVVITPPDATDGVTSNSLGLVGYQRCGGSVLVPWDFKGSISLAKRSANPTLSNDNACYRLDGARYGVFKSREDAASHEAAKALRTYTTDTRGEWASGKDFTVGTYYVAETAAPEGYELDGQTYEVNVQAGKNSVVNGGTGFVNDRPKNSPVSLWAKKVDGESADGKPQGNATLGGARFTIDYYDGYYTSVNSLPMEPTRTWVVATGDDGIASADDQHWIAGDPFYRTESGQITIPLGTVTIRESAAPEGYLVGDGENPSPIELFQVKDENGTTRGYTAPTFSDTVMRGGMTLGKADRQNGSLLPQGSASLAGAQFVIENASSKPVVVDGSVFQPGDTVKTLEAQVDATGQAIARTETDCLPVGSYIVRECAAADGYLFDEQSRAWSRRFDIEAQGQIVDLTGCGDAASNRVIRGDFAFSKVDGLSMERLEGVPFAVTSTTTGESHVIVTDENGMLSTASSWNMHTQRTNANDKAVEGKDGKVTVDESLLDASAGVWFGGRIDETCEADDAFGALPYDTYTISELRCASNKEHELVTFTVTITRDGRELDLGTVDDNAGTIVNTSISDENGMKLVSAGTKSIVTDVVSYTNLDLGEHYTMRGTMHLVDDDGTDAGIVAEASTPFTPMRPTGTVDVDFLLDTTDLEGARVVAFEELLNAEGVVVAAHEDLMYEGQTVRVPVIGTTLTDAADDDHAAFVDGTVHLVDVIAYEGLTPGDAYTVSGTLHLRGENGADLGAATDDSGQPIRAHASFCAAQSQGSVQVEFVFNAQQLAGRDVVAFEELSRHDQVYATHADIADTKQTVRLESQPVIPVVPEEAIPEAPVVEKEQPQPKETIVVEKVVEESPTPQPATIAKTGDSMLLLAVALIPAALIGLIFATLAIRRMQRADDIYVARGPRRR